MGGRVSKQSQPTRKRLAGKGRRSQSESHAYSGQRYALKIDGHCSCSVSQPRPGRSFGGHATHPLAPRGSGWFARRFGRGVCRVLTPLTGAGVTMHLSTRLTPWATIFRPAGWSRGWPAREVSSTPRHTQLRPRRPWRRHILNEPYHGISHGEMESWTGRITRLCSAFRKAHRQGHSGISVGVCTAKTRTSSGGQCALSAPWPRIPPLPLPELPEVIPLPLGTATVRVTSRRAFSTCPRGLRQPFP